MVKRIEPFYVTLEHISRDPDEHACLLRQGVNVLMNFCEKFLKNPLRVLSAADFHVINILDIP